MIAGIRVVPAAPSRPPKRVPLAPPDPPSQLRVVLLSAPVFFSAVPRRRRPCTMPSPTPRHQADPVRLIATVGYVATSDCPGTSVRAGLLFTALWGASRCGRVAADRPLFAVVIWSGTRRALLRRHRPCRCDREVSASDHALIQAVGLSTATGVLVVPIFDVIKPFPHAAREPPRRAGRDVRRC